MKLKAGRCPVCPPSTPSQQRVVGEDYEYGTVPGTFGVSSCAWCGTLFLNPRPDDSEIAGLYPPHYEPWAFDSLPPLVRAGRDLVQASKVRSLAQDVAPEASILDLGCGAGALLRLMRRFGSPRWTLGGWDFPGPHLERVRSDGFEVISAPIDDANLPARQFDAVVMNQVIEHFGEPDAIMRLVARVVPAGGKVFIETPDVDGLDAKLFGRAWGGFHFPRHMVLFNARSLRALVEQAGFAVERIEHLASPAFWIQSLHHATAMSPLKPLRKLWSIRNPFALSAATLLDTGLAMLGPTSNLRLVARRRVDL